MGVHVHALAAKADALHFETHALFERRFST